MLPGFAARFALTHTYPHLFALTRCAIHVGDLPLDTSIYRLGKLAVVTLVLLRLGVGWHFFQEGVTKIHDPSWSAEGFLTGSKGPLKPVFESFVWDLDGRARLNYAEKNGRPTIDLEPTMEAWELFRVRVEDHYRFDENQKKAAQKCYDNWVAQLKWYFDANRDDIVEYFEGLDRVEANEKDAAKSEVESLRGQGTKIAGEVSAARGPWLASVKKMWTGYGDELNAIATDEQRSAGPLAIGKPARRFLDTETINVIIPYFDTIVGVLLILGLFTRLAALAGAGFSVLYRPDSMARSSPGLAGLLSNDRNAGFAGAGCYGGWTICGAGFCCPQPVQAVLEF